jgi:hypothetical protein
MKGKKIPDRPRKMNATVDRVRINFVLLAMAAVIGFAAGACCPKEIPETGNAIIADTEPPYAGPRPKSIQAETTAGSDAISRSAKAEAFLIVDEKHRGTGSDPMPRRKLNRKKYVSIRAKGGDAQ